MAEKTGIAWCDSTFNPWVGCSKISPGCTHCYAEALAHRFGQAQWGPHAQRVPCSGGYWNQLLKWEKKALKAGRPWLVFCGSMCDVFEDCDQEHVLRGRRLLWNAIEDTPSLFWLLLTKRPQNIVRMVPGGEEVPLDGAFKKDWRLDPPHNVMYLTSVEDQAAAESRIDALCRTPSRFRGLSVEPLISRVNMKLGEWQVNPQDDGADGYRRYHRIHWVIAGGESGPKARPCDVDWLVSVQYQCQAFRVPYFLKQFGSRPTGYLAEEVGLLADSKGADPAEWPPEYRIREFPAAFSR